MQRHRPSGADHEDALARLHLIRFHGVLATNARLRAQVVPKPSPEVAPVTQAAVSEENDTPRTVRPNWVRLLKRVFDLDLVHCPNCSGKLTIIAAAILESPVIEKILTHLGLQARPPPRAPARGQMPLQAVF